MNGNNARCAALPVLARRPISLVTLAIVALAVSLWAQETEPKVSQKPLTVEQLGVYRMVLVEWMQHGTNSVILAIETTPLATSGAFGDEECAKGLEVEPAPAIMVHRFRQADLAKLDANIVLVDPDQGRKDVADNDPEKGMGKGKSIEESVRNGFAHGLFTLSEIQFDKGHKHAIVSYSFVCGGLCGNGGTIVLEKVEGGWRRGKHCHDWIS